LPKADLDPPLVCVHGVVGRQRVRRGSASEHDSWTLDSPTHGVLLLKRLGANPFELGEPPAAPGSEVECEGYLRGNELRWRSIRPA
jgi:hypothetical protein